MKQFSRLLLWVATLLLAAVIVVYAVYQYTIDRYADQLTDILDTIAQQPSAETPTTPIEPTPQQPTPPSVSNEPQPSDPPAAQQPGSEPTVPSPKEQPPTAPPAEPGPADTPDPPAPAEPEQPQELAMVTDATENLNLSAAEKADVSVALDVLGKMSMQDKMFFFQTVTKFSPAEILEMYRLYSQGDSESIGQVKEKLLSKFTSEDIAKIKAIAEKYQPQVDDAKTP